MGGGGGVGGGGGAPVVGLEGLKNIECPQNIKDPEEK